MIVLPQVAKKNTSSTVPNNYSSPTSNGVKKTKLVPNNNDGDSETFLIHSNCNGKSRNADGYEMTLKTG